MVDSQTVLPCTYPLILACPIVASTANNKTSSKQFLADKADIPLIYPKTSKRAIDCEPAPAKIAYI